MKPMLAQTVEDISTLTYPLYVSPKLDGIRMIVKDGECLSRSLKPIPNKYIQKMYGREELNGFDGEVIVSDPTAEDVFKKSHSVAMSRDKDPLDYGDVVFYVFDNFDSDDIFANRYEKIKYSVYSAYLFQCLDKSSLHLVQQRVCENPKEVMRWHDHYMQKGYEGTMLRGIESPYKHGRSTLKQGYLLKIKDFADAEGTIIGFVEMQHNDNEEKKNELGHTERSSAKAGKRAAGMMGTIVVETEFKGGIVELEIGTGFTHADRQEIWDNQEEWLGKTVKYKFQEAGSDVRPRLPVFLGVRDKRDM